MTDPLRMRGLMEFIDDLATCPSESALAAEAPRAIMKLVGADVAAFTMIDVRNGTAHLDLYPDDPRFSLPARHTAQTLGDNPVVRHWAAGTDLTPRRVTDLVNRTEWRRTSTFANVLGPMGTPYLLGIPLYRSTTGGPSYAIARATHDFTDAELGAVSSAQAALLMLHRRLRPRSRPHADRVALSARELQVLELLAAGLSGRQMARQLGLAAATVRKHLERVYAKLGVHDRLNAIYVGEDRGLIEKRR